MNMMNKLMAKHIEVFWYPFTLLLILIFLMLIFHWWGKKYFRHDFNKNTDQTKPYNSGNLDEVDYNIKSSNLYWGFRKAIQPFFDKMQAFHNGDLNDYVKWYILFIGFCLLLLGAGLL